MIPIGLKIHLGHNWKWSTELQQKQQKATTTTTWPHNEMSTRRNALGRSNLVTGLDCTTFPATTTIWLANKNGITRNIQRAKIYILCHSRFGGQRDTNGDERTKANGRNRPATWTAKCCSRRSTRGQLRTLLATLQFPFSSRCLSTKNDAAFKWIFCQTIKGRISKCKTE